MFLHKQYNGFKADIFSLGQLLFYLVTVQYGFNFSSINDKFNSLIITNNIDVFWEHFKELNLNLSQSFKNLFIRMVSNNPNNRPNIDQILTDVWMDEINII